MLKINKAILITAVCVFKVYNYLFSVSIYQSEHLSSFIAGFFYLSQLDLFSINPSIFYLFIYPGLNCVMLFCSSGPT